MQFCNIEKGKNISIILFSYLSHFNVKYQLANNFIRLSVYSYSDISLKEYSRGEMVLELMNQLSHLFLLEIPYI